MADYVSGQTGPADGTMIRTGAAELAEFDPGLAQVQKKMWRIFIGACVLSLILILLLLALILTEQAFRRTLLILLTALLLWSGMVTVYAFHSLHLFAQQIRNQLARRVFVDGLTDVFNFHYLECRLRQEQERVRRYGGSTAILYVDLDRFKEVNDSYGHHIGNLVLKGIAAGMAGKVRGSDALGRVGGDEFVVILPHANRDEAMTVAHNLTECVAAYSLDLKERGRIDFVTASVGVAAYPADGDSMETVVSAADSGVYEAKRLGGNTACLAGQPAEGQHSSVAR